MAEFLPLCDVLFNIISLTLYFCNVVFDVVLSWALHTRGSKMYFVIALCIIFFALVISQIISLRWYLKEKHKTDRQIVTTTTNSSDTNQNLPLGKEHELADNEKRERITRYAVVACHLSCVGIFWRYAKLFVPVDLRTVKHEVRDLCVLRVIHAFCEAAPMLLLQLHVYISFQKEVSINKLEALGEHVITPLIQESSIAQHQQRAFRDLNVVSAVLSLFSICWALASFSKHVRLQSVHRLVLTWLGVIFQFLWRLGTITSRVASLTIYSSVYGYWVLLVIAFHWSSMLAWLVVSKKSIFYDETLPKVRRMLVTLLMSFVYIFAYINLQDGSHKQKMTTFYVVMFLENCLLVFLWAIGIWHERPVHWFNIPILVIFSFSTGIFFMLAYYRYFHVRRLGYEAGGRLPTIEKQKKCNHQQGTCKCSGDSSGVRRAGVIGANCNGLKYPHAIPGVFNCRFSNPVNNVATKRKKKKPTTFVPPPMRPDAASSVTDGPMAIPFWKRALPRAHTGNSSENDASSVGSRVNIQQKLQEKKQKQLAELKIIEEEIKQGKLTVPNKGGTLSSNDEQKASLPRQPIPRNKRHGEMPPIEWRSTSPFDTGYHNLNMILSANLAAVQQAQQQRQLQVAQQQQQQQHPTNNLNAFYNALSVAALSRSRHASPITTATPVNDNSLTRQIAAPRTKMPRTNNHGLYDAQRPPSISPRNTSTGHTKKNRPSPSPLAVGVTATDTGRSSSSKMTSSATTSANNSNTNTVVHNPYAQGPVNHKLLQQRQWQRIKTQTPEVLLAPHFENSRVYYDWMGRSERQQPYRIAERGQYMLPSSGEENVDCEESVNNPHSDLDSQISLPRSYTLPREFKYYRKIRRGKQLKNNVQNDNSSDGDVDDDSDCQSDNSQQAVPRLPSTITNRSSNNTPFTPMPNSYTTAVGSNGHCMAYNVSSRQVTNLDLLNGHAVPVTRTSRFRIHPNAVLRGYGVPRHETKL